MGFILQTKTMTPQDEIDAFLAEVDYTTQKINDLASGRINPEDFDRELKRKELRKQREQEEDQRRKESLEKKKREGRPGKGEKENYKSFCQTCFWEYEIESGQCLRCGKNTISFEERREYLNGKVEEFKVRKIKREERKKKWEMWKKTQQIYWKKSQTNYSKWDYFTSESEDEEEGDKDPYVPKDDPQFQALERDIKERSKRKKESRQKADALKTKANELFAQGDYKGAKNLYSEAIDECRDYMVLYTNRALAYMKLGRFSRAEEDCTKLLEYYEVFEDGYQKSSEICFKALLRRANTRYEQNKLEGALKDCEECLKLKKGNEEVKALQKNIEEKMKHQQEAQQLQDEVKKIEETQHQGQIVEASKSKDEKRMKDYIEELVAKDEITQEDLNMVVKFLALGKEGKLYLHSKKGLDMLMKAAKKNVAGCYFTLNVFLEGNIVFQEDFIKKKGLKTIIDELNKEEENFGIYEDIFDILVSMAQNERLRAQLANDVDLVVALQKCLWKLIDRVNVEHESLSGLISVISNLCVTGAQNTVLRQSICKNFDEVCKVLTAILNKDKKRYLKLNENVYNMVVNSLTDSSIRQLYTCLLYTSPSPRDS
eukprot:TRINITY_DN2297_c0_g1_i4.p1 TRINITY_DN2297_c0_g1~~TRINITY_DN2297_c0_g1_i4.p1  ORF type:complete len:600 (-),score=122.17 TRINITY_DN2297_c0_g1_i4:39-1838(-)